MKKLRLQISNTKQAKGTRTTVPKRDAYSFIEINLQKSDIPEDIKMWIETEFGIKVVEQRE